MNIHKRSCYIFLISILACGTLCGQGPVKSCRLTITSTLATVESGAEARVQISLTNTSSTEITIPLVVQPIHADTHYVLTVTNEAGHPTPQTLYGRVLKRNPAEGSFGFSVVKPGETLKEEIVVTKLYDITVPGKYVLQVTGEWSDIGLVKSNSITITVTP